MRQEAKRGLGPIALFLSGRAFLAALACLVLTGFLPQQSTGSSLSKTVVGYYPSWARAEFDHTRIEYSSLTHIAHAFAWPDPEGNLIVPEGYVYPELVAAAHANGVKMIMSIGGWGNCDGFAPMASLSATRGGFINQVVQFCREQGYDGVDIDWEFVEGDGQEQDFSLLIRELWAALKAMNPPRLLTMAAPADEYYARWIDFESLHPYFDFIGFMTYDFHGEWSDHSGHNSPLYSCGGDACGSVDKTFNYARERQVPLEKLLLGVPFYGRSFDSQGLYAPFQTSRGYAFHEAADLWAQGWSYQWDHCAKVPTLVAPGGKEILSYDDVFSVAWKCLYVNDKQVAGVIIWELSQDGLPGSPFSPFLIKVFPIFFGGAGGAAARK